MATYSCENIDEFSKAFDIDTDCPMEIREMMLKAMANVAVEKEKEQGEAMGVRDDESTEHILDHFKINKPKIEFMKGSITITFTGNRVDKKHSQKAKTRNAEIAFINEFGKKGQPARPFMKIALEKYGDEINEAAARIWQAWTDKTI